MVPRGAKFSRRCKVINYVVDLLSKPKYQWSVLDKLAGFGLILLLLVIVFIIWASILFIVDRIKKRKFNSCKKRICGDVCWHHKDCLNCSFYKKKENTDGDD